MIEMRVGHEDEVDFRQMMDLEPRLLQPLDYFKPLRPNRVDQQIELVGLNQERRVSDPRNADFAFADFREMGTRAIARALGEERRDEDFGEEIAPVPVRTRNQANASRALV